MRKVKTYEIRWTQENVNAILLSRFHDEVWSVTFHGHDQIFIKFETTPFKFFLIRIMIFIKTGKWPKTHK